MPNIFNRLNKYNHLIFFGLLIFLGSLNSFSQDIYKDLVYLNNGIVLKGELLENQKPDYLIIKDDSLGMITVNYSDIRIFKPKVSRQDPFFIKKEHNYHAFSIGLGHSYGGIGIKYQRRIGRSFGFGYFLGMGYNQYEMVEESATIRMVNQDIGLSFGLKIYVYKWFYISTGLLLNISENDSELPYTFLTGIDYYISTRLGINAAIGVYNSKYFLIGSENLGFDLGLSYKFPIK